MTLVSLKPVILIATLLTAWDGPPDDNPEHPVWNPELSKLFRQLGNWEDQAPVFSQALENMWERNGWNTEADNAALEFSRELTSIPPWNFRARMNLLSEAVRERYGLSSEQSDKFEQMAFREAWTMGLKYGPTMIQHATGLLEARSKGQPFNPQAIAEFEQAMDPHIDGMVADMERFIDTFAENLTPAQKRILARDRASFEKRKTHFLEARQRWMRGEWTPDEWGLEDDPVHAEVMRRLLRPRISVDAALTGTFDHDESTWHRYVRQFIELYDLDSSQQQSCRAILQDLVSRARSYLAPRRDELQTISRVQRMTAPEFEPIRVMFKELQNRLAAIPTSEQIQTAQIRRPEAFRVPRKSRARRGPQSGPVSRGRN